MVAGAAQKATKYLKEAGYKCPTDPKDGLMQYVTPQPLKGKVIVFSHVEFINLPP